MAASRVTVPAVQAIARPRLEDALHRVQARAALVFGPAGSGKSTLLACVARDHRFPVAWYRAEAGRSTLSTVVSHLGEAFAAAGVVRPKPDWRSVDDALRDLERVPRDGTLLIVDDLHLLDPDIARDVFEPLLGAAPDRLRLVFGSRTVPSVNLTRLRVADQLVELNDRDLRFRAWETERLFREHYGEPLPPSDLAELTRRTEGWAAGLHLFHLASRGKPPRERQKMVAALSSRHRLVRDYLASNVLRDLDPGLQSFLMATCVLGLLTAPLCDRLTGRPGSGVLLEELERRQIFTLTVDDLGTYRYHEVLRQYLEQALVATVGETETCARFQRAGALLEAAGAAPEALRAYAQAGDLTAATRLLGGRGEELARRSSDMISGVLSTFPEWLVDENPWLLLADARRLVATGRWAPGLERYREAERAFGVGAAADRCRQQRLALASWLAPMPGDPATCVGAVRKATQRDPQGVRSRSTETTATCCLVDGMAALLSGALATAARTLGAGADDPDADSVTAYALRLGAGLATILLATDVAAGVAAAEAALDQAEHLQITVAIRLARSMLAATGQEMAELESQAIRRERDAVGDAWTSAFALYFEGLGRLLADRPDEGRLEEATRRFAALDAAVLAAWARAGAAASLARAGDPRAPDFAEEAVRAARACRCGGAGALAMAARDLLRDEASVDRRTQSLAERIGLAPSRLWDAVCGPKPTSDHHWMGPPGHPTARRPAVRSQSPTAQSPTAQPRTSSVRCFGGLSLVLGGRALDLHHVRPRAQSTLRLLAVNAGSSVHREQLASALWPDSAPDAAARNVQVAVSAVRGLLSSASDIDTPSVGVVRDGERYTLVLPPGTHVDVIDFRDRVFRARANVSEGDLGGAVESFGAALDLYTDELFPEEGATDWAVAERHGFRSLAVEASRTRAELLIELDLPMEATDESKRGLALDEFDDALWRVLIRANERSSNPAGASVARQQYADVLDRLGVSVP